MASRTRNGSITRMRTLRPYLGACPHPVSAPVSLSALDESVSSTSEPLYWFNSLGYRSEEFQPCTDLKVFVCGCSHAFGYGLSVEDSWPHRVMSSLIGRRRPPVTGNLQNFSQIGASNQYILRTMLQQCGSFAPDLAIVSFTYANRTEYFDGAKILNIGPWSLTDADRAIHGLNSPGVRYYSAYSDTLGNLEVIKSMLLLQAFFVNRRIPYIFLWVEVGVLNDPKVTENIELSALAKLVDRTKVFPLSIKDPSIWVDTVLGHPGPISHSRYASAITDFIFASKATATHSDLRPTRSLPILSDRKGDSDVPSQSSETHDVYQIECQIEPEVSLDRLTRLTLVNADAKGHRIRLHLPPPSLGELPTNQSFVEISDALINFGPPEIAHLAASRVAYLNEELRLYSWIRNVLLLSEFFRFWNSPADFVTDEIVAEQLAGCRHPILVGIKELLPKCEKGKRENHAPPRAGPRPRAPLGGVSAFQFFLQMAGTAARYLKARSAKKRLKKKLKEEDPNIYPLW